MILNRTLRTLQLTLPLVKVKYNFTYWDWEQLPKPWNTKNTKKQKRLLFNKQNAPFPKYSTNLSDTLHIAGLEGKSLLSLYQDFLENSDLPLSSQNVALLIYNFAKEGYLNPTVWPILQNYIHRNRGEFGQRSIFGCLYGAIIYGQPQIIQFFIDEMKGQSLTFTDMESIEIIQAFNKSKFPFTQDYKFYFWDTYFKYHFLKNISQHSRIHKFKDVMRIFNAFDQFQYYHDEEIWNHVLSWLQRRKGWKRTEIIEKLYPLSGTIPKAKELFDHYYAELSLSPHIQWRYNLEEMRLYSSEEMIAKSQQNIEMHPSDRTLFSRKDQKRENEEYYEWLKDGARQKEAELVKDKAQSLAYAMKNRYESMRKDKVDFSKLSVEQFQDLFGTYDKNIMFKAQNQEDDIMPTQEDVQEMILKGQSLDEFRREKGQNRKQVMIQKKDSLLYMIS